MYTRQKVIFWGIYFMVVWITSPSQKEAEDYNRYCPNVEKTYYNPVFPHI